MRNESKAMPSPVLHDNRVKSDQDELKHEPTADELNKKMQEDRTRIKKPTTQAEMNAIEEKIANKITELKAEAAASDSDLFKHQTQRKIRSQQSLRSQYRKHFRNTISS